MGTKEGREEKREGGGRKGGREGRREKGGRKSRKKSTTTHYITKDSAYPSGLYCGTHR